MAAQTYRNRDGRVISQDEDVNRRIEEVVKLWTFARQLRYNHEVQSQEAALLLLPEFANTFWYGYDQWPGQKKTMQQVDVTGMLALDRFSAIVDSISTPFADVWHRLEAGGPDGAKLMRNRRVRQYFQKLNDCLWTHRYNQYANFRSQNVQDYQGIGVFGTCYMYVDEVDTRFTYGERGLRYKSVNWGMIYLMENHQGMVDSYFATCRLTARQIMQRWPDTFPEVLKTALDSGSQQKFWVLQYVFPRTERNPLVVTGDQMPWGSIYISIEGHILLEEKGYHSWPLPTWRWSQAPDEVYGRGIAQKILPSLKTLNAEKVVFLKQGHRAADPIYLSYDETINFKSHPGAWNVGGLSKDGKRLIDILPTGEIQVTQEMMVEERNAIRSGYLVDLFQMAWENPNSTQKSAREVIEFINDRGTLVAPTVGRGYSERTGPLLHREMAVLAYLDLLPDMPPELREAGGKYKVVDTSPLGRSLRASKVAGYLRLAETLGHLAQVTNDPSATDLITTGLPRAGPAIGQDMGVDEDWLGTAQELAAAVKNRQQQQAEENRVKALPAEAAIEKAHAITAKAQTGGNIGGTLSGTAPGQNPQIPGSPPGQPGQPGIGGQPGLPGQPAPQQ